MTHTITYNFSSYFVLIISRPLYPSASWTVSSRPWPFLIIAVSIFYPTETEISTASPSESSIATVSLSHTSTVFFQTARTSLLALSTRTTVSSLQVRRIFTTLTMRQWISRTTCTWTMTFLTTPLAICHAYEIKKAILIATVTETSRRHVIACTTTRTPTDILKSVTIRASIT